MISSLSRLLIAAILLSSLTLQARAGAVLDGDPADGMVLASGVNNGMYDHLYHFGIGALYNIDSGCLVEGFVLPYLAPGQQVTNATISFYLEGSTATPTFNLALYGLKRVSTTNGIPLTADWYTGTNDSANTLLDAKFITPSSAANSVVTYTGANMTSFIQAQYANAGFSGLDLSSSRYIFFRLTPDGTQNGYNSYNVSSARNPVRGNHPTLALTISNGISNIAGRLQFSFNLPVAADTSAGVYDSSGKLLRTLWNNVRYQQGTNYGVWDGKDDSGTALAAGTSYQIKLIYHNVKYVFQGMVGNTSTNRSGGNVYHSFGLIRDMTFSGNTGFYAVGYNELEAVFHSFTVGAPQVPSIINVGWNLVDSSACMYLVTSDSSRTYWAKTYGGMGAVGTYVVAITNGGAGQSSFYTFPKGNVPTGGNFIYPGCVDWDPTPNQPNSASGIAVQKSGNYLFVAHSNLNVVRVFDKNQGNQVGSFNVPNPTRLATTANGDVWVISNAATPTVLRYSFSGGTATLKQTISGLSGPAGVGVSADDSLLLIADAGSSQQIKAFNNSTGASAWSYGLAGGMTVNGPNITPNVFQFSVATGPGPAPAEAFIAFQPDNTFWIEDQGNDRVVHYSISGNTPVYIEQIDYTPCSYRATVDVTDATRVYNGFTEYSVNYSIPLGGTNGSWTLAKNWQFGLPDDATHMYYGFAQGFNNVATLSNGRTYGLANNMTSGSWDLFELPPSGQARYTGYSFVTNARIYEDGTLRFATFNNSALAYYSAPLTGFDSKNNPVWGSPALLGSTTIGATDPAPSAAFEWRPELTSSGILVDFDSSLSGTNYHLAGLPVGKSAFQWRSSPATNGTPSTWFPQDGKYDVGENVQYGGNIAMALGRNIVYGYHGEFWGGGEASQWVNFYDNGLMVGLFGTYENGGMGSDVVDGFAGNSFSPCLVHAPDGNVYLYHNDESNHSGTPRWLIQGWDGIAELDATGNIGSTATMGANTAGPAVSITSPPAGATYLNGNNIVIGASVAGSGANIKSVQFFDGTTSLGVISVAPFTLDYSGLSVGTHVITAQASDTAGNVTTSAPVTITIGADGTVAPPPSPLSLAVGAVAAQSVPMHWTEPSIAPTSSTIGQIISFQCDSPNDSFALSPTMVAGASPYNVSNFNVIGQGGTAALTFPKVLNSLGQTVSGLGLFSQMGASNTTNSTQSLPGTAQNLFSGGIFTTNVLDGIEISNIPYALYDVVVYSLPGGLHSGNAQTASVSVGDGAYMNGVISQTFNQMPTAYSIATVAPGVTASVTNANTIVVQGLTSPVLNLQGSNITGFQIVERPYDQGAPATFSVERATGASGSFSAVGSTSGTVLSFTDSSASGSTSYQYRVKAVNSFGSSAYSNTVTVTTPAGSSGTNTAPAANFASWQSQYFTAGQLTDATISGPTADPYGSGVPNLMAYALQLNPATVQPSNVPNPVVVNGHLSITYFVPTSITDINYIVEVSSDLSTWNSGTGYTSAVSNVTSSTGHTITVQDALPTTTQKHFMRLRVTQK